MTRADTQFSRARPLGSNAGGLGRSPLRLVGPGANQRAAVPGRAAWLISLGSGRQRRLPEAERAGLGAWEPVASPPTRPASGSRG